jgi:hypothetical protein
MERRATTPMVRYASPARCRPATRKTDRLIGRGALPTLHGVVEAPDLHVHGLAEPQALVAQVADEFSLEVLDWAVDVANGFEEREREESVDRFGHMDRAKLTAAVTPFK